MNLNYIKKQIDKHKIISFDIFDTLLVRMTRNPIEIFKIVENLYENKIKNNDFSNLRIKAETVARKKSNKEEITLENIYSNLEKFSKKEKKELLALEVEVEKKFLKKNPIIEEIYNYCILRKKKIIIESDMYLPKQVIVDILKMNGIKYNELFLSSDLFLTKRRGSMYQFVISKLNCSPTNILHIGDSIRSDFIKPRKYKINSVLIPKFVNNNSKNISFKEFDLLIKKKSETKKDIYKKLGFDILGPLYLTYSTWLKNNLIKNNINKAFFFFIDGYIMKKGFDLIKGKIDSHYLYVSRKSLITPALYYMNSYNEVIDITNIEVLESIDVELFVDKLGLNIESCKDEIKKLGLHKNTQIRGSNIKNNYKIKRLYELIKEKVKNNSKKQLEELLKYLKYNDFNGKVAIIDIGWQGTMQKALEIIAKHSNLNVEIFGFYMGIKKNAKEFKNGKMFGFCFDPINNKYENVFFAFGGLFEFFYSNVDGTVKEYKNNKPVLMKNEYSGTNYFNIMIYIQEGGLEYLRIALKYYKYFNIIDGKQYSIENVVKLGIKPKLKNLKIFKRLYYYNSKNFYLLPQHSIFYYFLHLFKLKQEINQSFWKVGYLKQLLKLPLPYYYVYKFLKGR